MLLNLYRANKGTQQPQNSKALLNLINRCCSFSQEMSQDALNVLLTTKKHPLGRLRKRGPPSGHSHRYHCRYGEALQLHSVTLLGLTSGGVNAIFTYRKFEEWIPEHMHRERRPAPTPISPPIKPRRL